MSDTTAVPEPPKEQVIIPQEDSQRLQGWVNFFRKLSPRISILTREQWGFEECYEKGQNSVCRTCKVPTNTRVNDWPEEHEVAFFLTYVIRERCGEEIDQPYTTYVFCFGNRAFGLGYFANDGDSMFEQFGLTLSLGGETQEDLTWESIKDEIIENIEDLESQVPEPPTS